MAASVCLSLALPNEESVNAKVRRTLQHARIKIDGIPLCTTHAQPSANPNRRSLLRDPSALQIPNQHLRQLPLPHFPPDMHDGSRVRHLWALNINGRRARVEQPRTPGSETSDVRGRRSVLG
jgi:hypothetical protein